MELPYRIIMAFTYYQQFTIPQIASLMNADENVVKTRLYQSRMRLLHKHCPLPT
ncbi:sigma factor-like helix-turn-helix DNA-binding protein [Aneurinibacillus migulanus]|uniref:sigma factor-like helix-turn-helix DNA-binding protein n=1 Tax=Aneurinibacillus migulanus TaxID=47500 RepID=UPI0039919444